MPELTGFRAAAWDTALRSIPHSESGRFHHAGSPPTQYISLHPLTPWAEYMRFHGLRSADDVAEYRLRTWAVRALVEDVVTIDFSTAGDFGLEPQDLVGDDWAPCQGLAERLRGDRSAPKVLEVPSAALPGTRGLVILGERVDLPYLWSPIDPGDLPACVAAEDGRPPDELADFVRYRGDRHAELEAWLSGEPYAFADLRRLPA